MFAVASEFHDHIIAGIIKVATSTMRIHVMLIIIFVVSGDHEYCFCCFRFC